MAFVIMEHRGHTPAAAWKSITGADCVMELAARCHNCQEGQFVHLTEDEVAEWFTRHGERWPYPYFQKDLGWDIEAGVCGACMRLIRELTGRLN